jgi:hypothetical protein
MMRRIRKIIRFGLIIFLLMILCGVGVFAVSSAPIFGDALLVIEIKEHHGDEVHVSVPLSLLKTSFNVMPKEIRKLCQELELTPDMITDELKTMDGEDLVRITGEDNIRIYVEPLTSSSAASQGFLKVHVKEGGRNGNNIHVWIPRGFISIAGKIVQTFGIVDRFVELPPEITNLEIKKISF